MAHIHEIGIAAETRGFDQGFKTGVIRPVEDAVDAFKDLERAVEQPDMSNILRDFDELDDAAKKATDRTDDLGDDGARSLRKLEKALEDAQRETEQLGRKSRDAGDDSQRGFGRMRAASEEVTQEIGQNLGEAVSSIRGDMSDLGQVGQDTLGGLAATVAGMGPGGLIGAIALAAGATGLGLLTAGLQDTEERQERLKEQAGEWAQAYIDAGASVLNTAQIVAKGQELLVDRGDEVKRNAELWGVGVATAAAAMAGSQTAIDQVSDSLDRQQSALEANAGGADNYAQNIEAATTGQSQANNSVIEGRKAFDELTGAMQLGKETASFVSQMMVDVARNTEGATETVDEFGDTVITLPDGKKVYVDAETGQATQDVEAIEQKIYGIPNKTATVNLVVNDRDLRNYRPPTITIPGQIVPRGTVAQY